MRQIEFNYFGIFPSLKADDFIPAEVEDLQVGVEGEVCVVDLLHVVVGEIEILEVVVEPSWEGEEAPPAAVC